MMDVLTSKVKRSDRVSGEIWLNGNQIPIRSLGTRVAYVRRDYRLHPDITVIQTMQFHGINIDAAVGDKRKRVGVMLTAYYIHAKLDNIIKTCSFPILDARAAGGLGPVASALISG